MLKTILVPLDGSPLAERAVPYATALARASKARLILLHVGWEGSPFLGMGAALTKLVDQLRAAGVEAEQHERVASRAEETGPVLCQAARTVQADLILMSTHGRGGLGRWVYGSTADQVLRHADVPILLVPASCDRPWPEDRPLRILVPLDGSEFAEEVLGPADDLAETLGAALLLLRVSAPTGYALQLEAAVHLLDDPEAELAQARRYLGELAARLRAAGRTVTVRAEPGYPGPAIVAVARDEGVDLIVMATHGRGGLARMLLGSIATGILHRAATPLMLVRPVALRQLAASTEPARQPAEAAPRPADAGIGGRVQVGQIMAQPIVTVPENTPVKLIAQLMLDRDIGGAPVVDADGDLVGIVTESDFTGKHADLPASILRVPYLFSRWVSPEQIESICGGAYYKTARDIMTAPVITATADELVTELVRRMVRYDVHQIPVVRGRTPIGIVARRDLLRLLAQEEAGEKVHAQAE